jgi:DNA-binding NtrC family response regulator
MRILFVDDEVFQSDSFRQHLIFEGYQVESATGVKEAFRNIDIGEYDILVTDVMMAGEGLLGELETKGGFLSGIYVAKASQRLYPTKPVFIHTAFKDVMGMSDIDSIVRASGLKAKVIKKYFDIELKLKIIKSLPITTTADLAINKSLYDALKIEPNFMGIGIDVKKLIAWLGKNRSNS